MDHVMSDAALIEQALQKLFTMQEDAAPIRGVSIVCLREDETIFAVHNVNAVDLHLVALALAEASNKIMEAIKSHAN